MKKFIFISMCALTLMACGKQEPPEVETPKEIVMGNAFMLINELPDKSLDIKAFETNVSENGKFYYQLKIKNNNNEAIDLSKIKIVLLDSKGKEREAGLIDHVLIEMLDANSVVEGTVGFDGLGNAIPESLKIEMQ